MMSTRQNESANVTTGGSFEDNVVAQEDLLVNRILMYVLPIIYAIGVFGNVLIVIIMSKPHNRKLTAATYFTALAISDTLLFTQVMVLKWCTDYLGLRMYQPNVISDTAKAMAILIYTNSFISIWILVAVTMDRLACVVFPLRSRIYCNVPRARIIVAVICVLLFVMSTALYVLLQDVSYVLFYGFDFKETVPGGSNIVFWTLFCVAIAVPYVLITSGTIVLVVFIRRKAFGITQISSRNMSATRNLLFANFGFIITTSPYTTFVILLHTGLLKLNQNQIALGLRIGTVILECNTLLNFYLYILSGSRFRTDVKQLFSDVVKCCRSKATMDRVNSDNTTDTAS